MHASPAETDYLQSLSSTLVAYSLTIAMAKASILLLYRRIFSTPNFKRSTQVIGAIIIAWSVAAILCFIFQCHPVSGMWNPAAMFTNKCIDLRAYYAGIAGANVCLDVVVLCMPLYTIWHLKLKASQKLMLFGIFALGGL